MTAFYRKTDRQENSIHIYSPSGRCHSSSPCTLFVQTSAFQTVDVPSRPRLRVVDGLHLAGLPFHPPGSVEDILPTSCGAAHSDDFEPGQ